MAAITTPSTGMPSTGGQITSLQLANLFNEILTWINNASNIDESNVDLTGTDGIVGKSTAQTITGVKTFENQAVAAGGLRTVLNISHNPVSGTAADADGISIPFLGDDDGGTQTTFARMDVLFDDTGASSEDSSINFRIIQAATAREILSLGSTEVTFNEDSVDIDFRIESNGEANLFFVDGGSDAVVIGNNATVAIAGSTYAFEILGTGAADTGFATARWSADATGPLVNIGKSRNAAIGSFTIVVDNDVLGTIQFVADDGVDMVTPGASIFARVNGTPGANDMPTELVFATTADAGSTVTERLTIDAAGLVSVVGSLNVDGTTDTTSTTTGSLQTDGGLGVAKALWVGTTSRLVGAVTMDAAPRPATNDGAALGVSGTAFSDLFLASGAVINFAGNNMSLTHATGAATLAGGSLSISAQPCFLVRSSADEANVTGDGTTHAVTWDTEILDKGSNFASNTFTAPVTGAYAIACQIMFSGVLSSHTYGYMQIVTSNRNYYVEFNPSTILPGVGGTGPTITWSQVVDMDVNDTVTVQAHVSGDTKVVDLTGGTATKFFSGALLN